jgi:hypothetical protein
MEMNVKMKPSSKMRDKLYFSGSKLNLSHFVTESVFQQINLETTSVLFAILGLENTR